MGKNQYEKINKYGIKKLKVGVGSILIASGFLVLGGGAYAADENNTSDHTSNLETIEVATPDQGQNTPQGEGNTPSSEEKVPAESLKEETNKAAETANEKVENETLKEESTIESNNKPTARRSGFRSISSVGQPRSGETGGAGSEENGVPASAESTTETPANYTGSVKLIGQWTGESSKKEDATNNYTSGTDKLGKPLDNPGLFRGIAKTFLGWSDKAPVNGKIAEGARLFSPEDTVATAFPKGIDANSKLYGVYFSLNEQDVPFPGDQIGMGIGLTNGLGKMNISEGTAITIDSSVKAEEVLPNTKLHKETTRTDIEKIETPSEEKSPLEKLLEELLGGGGTTTPKITEKKTEVRTILDKYKADNNDTTKVNEVVLNSEFEMDNTTAMLVYKNPWVGYVGPVLSNTYKNNTLDIDGKNYTYVDLNVNLDKDLTVPEKLFVEFNGYSWRPLYAIGVNGATREKLNIFSTANDNLGNTKESFNTLISNTDPKVTFGIETKGYKNLTFRMILRSKGANDNTNGTTEAIAENLVVADEGKSVAETITRNMTLRSLTSTEIKALFPTKTEEEINAMVIRVAQAKASELGDTNGEKVLKITGSIEGNAVANGGRISILNLRHEAPINKVDANILELGYVKDYKVTYEYRSGVQGVALPQDIVVLTPTDTAEYVDGTSITAKQPAQTTFDDKANDGVWTFKGYVNAQGAVQNEQTINKADIHFIGEWEFEAKKYKVTYEYQSAHTDIALPQDIKDLTPKDNATYKNGIEVPAARPAKTTFDDTVNDGVWTFKGYDHEKQTIDKKDLHFIGKWEFEANKYKVTYEYQSATPGIALPQGIKDLEPNDDKTYVNKTEVPATQPTQTTFADAINDGVWTFKGYDHEKQTIDKKDLHFIGKWEFEANKYKVTYEYQSATPGIALPQGIKDLEPKDNDTYKNGVEVPATQPTQTTFVDAINDGVWTFKGYDHEKQTIDKKDLHFIGGWEFAKNKKGSVNINYISTDGKIIKPKVVDTKDGASGTRYNAAEKGEKPDTITFEGKEYKLVTKAGTTTATAEVPATTYGADAVATGEGHAAVEGEVVVGETLEVTYVYEEVKTPIEPPKPEPKPEPKPDPKPEPKPEPKLEPKSESTPEIKPTPKKKEVEKPQVKEEKVLPNTKANSTSGVGVLGVLGVLGIAIATRRREK